MLRLKAIERFAQGFAVQRVGVDVLYAVDKAVTVAREPENRGAGFQERLRYASARDSRSSNDQRSSCVFEAKVSPVFFLRPEVFSPRAGES